MDIIELDNIGEDRTEREQTEREEQTEEADTSFTEQSESTQIFDGSNPRFGHFTDLNDFDSTNLERKIQDRINRKATQRYYAVKALEEATGIKFSVTHGDNSKELIDNISDFKYSEKGNLIALKFKGEDVKLTKKGKLDRRSDKTYNKDILKAIENAKVEYNASINAPINESVGLSVSEVAVKSVQESVVGSLEYPVREKYDEISQNDQDKNIYREINGIPHVDDNVDYDNLEDSNKKAQYNAKIAGLKVNIEHWKDLEQREQDSVKKRLYKTAKELCITKKSYMEVKAGFRPESEEALSLIQEEARTNDLTRFERFRKWAKENIAGVSAVAISIAGIITTIVIAGRSAVKKGAKAVGQFGKALANIAKKAAPAIATILNILAQALTWGAKALEFLSRNLWIVALALTYFLYNEIKDRRSGKTKYTYNK